MDASLYRSVNRFADHTPWLHGPAIAFATYGVVVFAALLALAWWRARQSRDLDGQAGVGWAAGASLIAIGLGQIIGHLVNRARPYAAMPHVDVLVSKSTDVSFPSDHALMAGGTAVGLLLVDRKLGRVAAVLAVLMAFTRVYVGAHYPTDVLAGLVIAGAVAAAGSRPGRWLVGELLVRASALRAIRTITNLEPKDREPV